ncbi:MAG TPA: hypothetical protein VHV29_09965 [Terriglobales bacterium]|jgi:hypothetical protein|nr:hypothetical protein [Terriglobales bacterium]
MPKITTVYDRKLPTKIPAELLESQQQGREGKGMNEKTLNETLADANMGVDITE